MKTFYITLTLLLITTLSFSQDVRREFGIISPDELDMTTYEKDPDTEAVVLFDIGKSIFFDTDNGYDIRFTRVRRIKILKRAGVEFSEVAIPFYVDGYGKTEQVKSIEAYTYNRENGFLTRKALDPKSVYEERINDYWRVKKFVFPDVKEGSIIEYRYVHETPFHFNLPDWTFQDKIPTVYSEYTVRMIPFYEYVFLVRGINRFDYQRSVVAKEKRTFGKINTSYGQNVGTGFEFQDYIHTYVKKDVPAFRDESYITSPDDYLMKMDFQLAKLYYPTGGSREIMTTWEKLAEDLLKHQDFGNYLSKSKRYAKKILDSEITFESQSELEKSKAIIEYVKSSFSWNGYYSEYASKSPKEFVEQKTGNSADINLFLTSLLTNAGINAKPVILSTRNHGKIYADYPFSHFFNYVIVLVDDSFLADGTESFVAFDRLPPRCINDKGLLIDDKEPVWVDLTKNPVSVSNTTITTDIDAEVLTAKSLISIQSNEYEALALKRTFHDDTTKLKNNYLDRGFLKVDNMKTFNYSKSQGPYILTFTGEAGVEKLGNKLILTPFLNFPLKNNQLTQDKRSYPVDFIYSKTKHLKSTIGIPDGFKIIHLPENYSIDNELVNINLSFKELNGLVESSGSYSFKKAVYNSNEYSRIKSYIDIIIKKFNEQIVIEKI